MSLSEDDRTEFHEAHPPLAQEIGDIGPQPELPSDFKPRMLNWTVLLIPWLPPKETKGGVLLPDQVVEANDFHSYIGRIVALGPLAFNHPKLRGGIREGYRGRYTDSAGNERWFEQEEVKFADGVSPPGVGDWVIMRKHAGIRFEFRGIPLRLCYDDDLLVQLESPLGWKAYV